MREVSWLSQSALLERQYQQEVLDLLPYREVDQEKLYHKSTILLLNPLRSQISPEYSHDHDDLERLLQEDTALAHVENAGGYRERVTLRKFKRFKVLTFRYLRVTPKSLACLLLYIGISRDSFADLLGLSRKSLTVWQQNFHVQHLFGAQIGYQCGLYHVAKILLRHGVIPYSLATFLGVYHPKWANTEENTLRTYARNP